MEVQGALDLGLEHVGEALPRQSGGSAVVDDAGQPREAEYLFAPYSAFTVVSAAWNMGTSLDPHVIELEAAVDNKEAWEWGPQEV